MGKNILGRGNSKGQGSRAESKLEETQDNKVSRASVNGGGSDPRALRMDYRRQSRDCDAKGLCCPMEKPFTKVYQKFTLPLTTKVYNAHSDISCVWDLLPTETANLLIS